MVLIIIKECEINYNLNYNNFSRFNSFFFLLIQAFNLCNCWFELYYMHLNLHRQGQNYNGDVKHTFKCF